MEIRMLTTEYSDGTKLIRNFSGSPLTYDGKVVAVVNWGIPCARG